MNLKLTSFAAATTLLLAGTAFAASGPTDPQIAHIAYTAGALDIEAGKLALAKSRNAAVRAFAEEMVRDHRAVNDQALALVGKLKVTPEDNATSKALASQAGVRLKRLKTLNGAAFDRAYTANEIAYHRQVNGALKDLLIPSSDNGELKSLLEVGLTLFREHQAHAEHLSRQLR